MWLEPRSDTELLKDLIEENLVNKLINATDPLRALQAQEAKFRFIKTLKYICENMWDYSYEEMAKQLNEMGLISRRKEWHAKSLYNKFHKYTGGTGICGRNNF